MRAEEFEMKSCSRQLYSRGSITVYAALMMCALVPLFFAAILSVKVKAGRMQAANSVDQSLFSLMAHYDRQLVRDFDLFVSAMEYLNGKEECIDFRSFIIFRQWADELMNKLHLMLKDMVKPKDIMRILRAAYDARLILKPDFDSFVKTFDKEGMVSYGTYKHYMRHGDHPLIDEDSYKEYLNMSMKWKEKWVD